MHLVFDSAAPREVWVAPKLDDVPPVGAVATEAASYELPVSGPGPNDLVIVWNRKTGNVASKPLAQARSGWTVAPSEYKRLGKVTVRVEHQGKPVAAAGIVLEAGGKKLNRVLSPADQGEVAFFGLVPGSAKVEVTFSSGGKTLASPAQTFELKLNRDQADVKLTTVIDQDVSVVEPEKPPTPAPEGGAPGGAPSTGGGSVLGSIVVYVLGVVAALAVGYGLLRYVQKNQGLVEEKLGKLGVSIPKDASSTPDDDAGAPPPPNQPEPQQPILLGDADPSAAPLGPVSVTSSAFGAVANPRLVREDGSLLLIPETGGVLGRDAGADLSLPDETTLSRRHAELVRSGSEVTIRDLGSTNGTYVNGVKLADAPVSLQPGDAVQFGAMRCRYEV